MSICDYKVYLKYTDTKEYSGTYLSKVGQNFTGTQPHDMNFGLLRVFEDRAQDIKYPLFCIRDCLLCSTDLSALTNNTWNLVSVTIDTTATSKLEHSETRIFNFYYSEILLL